MFQVVARSSGFKIALVLFSLVLIAPKAYFELGDHSDAAIRLGQNLLFNNFLQGSYQPSYVPHGLFGFLQYPMDIGMNYVIAFIFYLSINTLILRYLPGSNIWLRLSIFLIIQLSIGLRFLPVVLVFLLLNHKLRAFELLILSCLLALYLNIRLSAGIILLSSVAIIALFRIASLNSKHFKGGEAMVLGLNLILFTFILSLPFGFDIVEYAGHQLEVLRNARFGLSLAKDWGVMFAIIAVAVINGCLLVILNSGKRSIISLMGISLIVLSYVYMRPDSGTAYVAFNFLWAFSLTELCRLKLDSVLKFGVVSIALSALLISHLLLPFGFKVTKVDPIYAWETFFKATKPGVSKWNTYPIESDFTVFPYQIQIAKDWEGGLPYISPTYISYSALSPNLDSLNAAELRKRIVIHLPNPNGSWSELNDINRSYLAFSNAITVGSIISRYEKIQVEEAQSYFELKDTIQHLPLRFQSFSIRDLEFGIERSDWIKTGQITLVKSKESLENEFIVALQLADGRIVEKQVSGPTLSKGIFLDYFIASSNYLDSALAIVAFKVNKL